MYDPFYIFYHVAMIASLCASSSVIILTWTRRQAPGTRSMIALAVFTFIWTLGFLLEANSTSLERQLFYTSIGYIGSTCVSVTWLLFAIHYTTNEKAITGWKIVPFCIIPLTTLILVWSNNYHHLMWYGEHLTESGPFTVTSKTYGTFFWISLIYNYILIIAGAVILVRHLFKRTNIFKGQAVSLVIAVGVPLIWNIFFVFNLLPIPRKDLTPVAFAISGIAIAFGFMRYQLFSAVPFAREFLIQQISEGVLSIDIQNHLLEANNTALNILGLGKDIAGKNINEIAQLSPLLEKIARHDPAYTEITLPVAGEQRIYEIKDIPMYDNKQNQIGRLIILYDITERKRQELEYRTIIHTTVDGFWIADMEGRFLDVNDAYCKMIGYSRDEILNMKIADVEAIEHREQTETRIKKIRENGQDRFETRHRCKDGTIIEVEVSVNYISSSGERMIVFIRDITERNRMQAKLIAQDRLASIGELSAGVAHEINNPLTIIRGYSELALRNNKDPEITADLKIIDSEVERASKIIDNLLTFAREHPDEKTPVNINELIIKTLELRRYEQEKNKISVITGFADNLPRVLANEFQLQQVFLNIVINAEFFMIEAHGKGTLTIITEKSGNSVHIRFTDDGPGISPENMRRLFTPFFTTKEIGKGTGLGLSICHGIISEHGGRIWADSTPGEGTTFNVDLPAYRGR